MTPSDVWPDLDLSDWQPYITTRLPRGQAPLVVMARRLDRSEPAIAAVGDDAEELVEGLPGDYLVMELEQSRLFRREAFEALFEPLVLSPWATRLVLLARRISLRTSLTVAWLLRRRR